MHFGESNIWSEEVGSQRGVGVFVKRAKQQQDILSGKKTTIHSVALTVGFSIDRLPHDSDQMFYTFPYNKGTTKF